MYDNKELFTSLCSVCSTDNAASILCVMSGARPGARIELDTEIKEMYSKRINEWPVELRTTHQGNPDRWYALAGQMILPLVVKRIENAIAAATVHHNQFTFVYCGNVEPYFVPRRVSTGGEMKRALCGAFDEESHTVYTAIAAILGYPLISKKAFTTFMGTDAEAHQNDTYKTRAHRSGLEIASLSIHSNKTVVYSLHVLLEPGRPIHVVQFNAMVERIRATFKGVSDKFVVRASVTP